MSAFLTFPNQNNFYFDSLAFLHFLFIVHLCVYIHCHTIIMAKIVLVTGGTGLVGKSIESIVKTENPQDETWIFVGSKDADLT